MSETHMPERPDLPRLDDASKRAYYERLGTMVDLVMPAGPSPTGGAFFCLVLVQPEQGQPPVYVCNAEPAALAPALFFTAYRFAGVDPNGVTPVETIVGALRKLSAAVELWEEEYDHPHEQRDAYKAARANALKVLDDVTPKPVKNKVPPRAVLGADAEPFRTRPSEGEGV